MAYYLMLPITLQALLTFFDEFYYHHKRGLPLWEIIGHPLDTLAVISCFMVVKYLPFNQDNLLLFVGMSAFSCLLITKDEGVHHKHCDAGESWLHAVLFILHPFVLIALGIIWYLLGPQTLISMESGEKALLETLLNGQIFAIVGFFFYQTFYWGFYAKRID